MTLQTLIESLKISKEDKSRYIQMAFHLESDIQENITKTHFQLSSETKIPYYEWQKFLETPEIAGWINETLRTMARASFNKSLVNMTKGEASSPEVNAFKALKEYNDENKKADNSHIVVMYLPKPDDN